LTEAVEFRYQIPGFFWPVGRTLNEAEKAKKATQKIGNFVKEKLGVKI